MFFTGEEQTQFFEQVLFTHFGYEIALQHYEFVSGGCINTGVKLHTPEGVFFLKWNIHDLEGMFEAEAQGLAHLAQAGVLRVPTIQGTGKIQDKAYLLMEYVEADDTNPKFWQGFGADLAALHRVSTPYFGLDTDNYIGSLRQTNTPTPSGIEFFIQYRLRVQVGLARYEGRLPAHWAEKFERLYERLPQLLPNEPPALLHGDLWCGNFIADRSGRAVLIDPAIYYGYREAELAFTRLFGGFSPDFYAAYHEAHPLSAGFEERVAVYNLYPLLVHLNLFGEAYLSGIERVLVRYA